MDGNFNTTVPRSSIVTNAGTQLRARKSPEAVASYAEVYKKTPEVMPRLEVLRVPGSEPVQYYLVDGFQRLEAMELCNIDRIPVTVLGEGDVRAAKLLAAKANITHGVQLTRADKRHKVLSFLQDDEWYKHSNRSIAEMCCVSHHLVGEVRDELIGERRKGVNASADEPDEEPATRTSRDGAERPAKKRSGTGKYDFQVYNTLFSKLVKGLDEQAGVYGVPAHDEERAGLHRLLKQFHAGLLKFQRRLNKIK